MVGIAKISIYLLAALIMIIMGWLFPQLNFQGVAVSTLALVLMVMTVIPMKWALFFCLIYIGFEGFFKIISDYHPLVHIGSDVLVIVLFLRTLTRAFTKGNPLPDYFPPLIALFVFHFVWIVITLFNPYSLGITASIAGSKIYVTMPLMFFFAYYNCDSTEDFHFYLKGFIFVAILHTGFGLYQAAVGAESVLSLHPRYAIQLEKYQNQAFRPFGLTNLPGGPAVYLAPMIPLGIYYALIQKNVMRVLLIGFCAAAISLILLCQIRASLLKAILGGAMFVGGFALVAVRSKRNKRVSFGAVALAGLILAFLIPKLVTNFTSMSEDNEAAVDRSLTLFDVNQIAHARHPVLQRFLMYIKDVPFGAGFARVGASAGAFQHLQATDPYFKPYYFFADNFWIACLVEIGIPGMLVLTLLIFLIVIKGYTSIKRIQSDEHKMLMYALLAAVVPIVVGLYGAEGILYNPDACFFWFLSGVLLKIPRIDSWHSKANTVTNEPLNDEILV